MRKLLWIPVLTMIIGCSGGGDDTPKQDPDQIVISGAISGIQSEATLNIGDIVNGTDVSGNYSVEVGDGTYQVIPSKNGFAFNPVGRTVTVSGSAQNNVNFAGTAIPTTNALSRSLDIFNPSSMSIDENTDSRLNVSMAQNALWFEGNQGGLIYLYVTGNFTLSATVSVRKTSDANAGVDCNVCLGGLMARSPDNRSGEDYVHIVSGNTPQGLGYETKNTNNSSSPFEPIADGSTDHELRICREGATFRMYQRAVGSNTWSLAATYNRPDLPPTLQVGFNIYTAQSGTLADLRVIYEDVSLQTFSGSPGCQ